MTKNKGFVILIEDNDSNRDAIAKSLEKIGFQVKSFALGEPAVKYLENFSGRAIVVSDIRLPDITGIDILKKVRKPDNRLGIILITGYGSIEDAVEAMKLGADDYLTKPLDMFKLRKQVEAINERLNLVEEVEDLKIRLDKRYGLQNIIGTSGAMEKVFEQVRLVAPSRSTVLITGESGTGKELIANAIHQLSPRKNNRFLPLNCAAISPTILESELFGHEKGAFTGATQRHLGKFELADQGTLFLDEISEINPDIQVKLLRVLEGMEFMRVGGTELINVDCRVIAATNKDLKSFVDSGKFREDLYYRLKVVMVHLPPLRERKEDIPILVDHFLNHFAEENRKKIPIMTNGTMDLMMRNNWQGNIRELRNLIQSLVVLNQDGKITKENLPAEYHIEESNDKIVDVDPDGLTMEELEKKAIYAALEKTGNNRTRAAKMLGIGLRTLQRKLKEYGDITADNE